MKTQTLDNCVRSTMRQWCLLTGLICVVAATLDCFAKPETEVAPGPAIVQTDKGDYHPGETVVITGSGFVPGEQVEFRVMHIDEEPDLGKERHKWQEKADDNGAVSTTCLRNKL